ncbi:MAG: hypothetical protein IT244_12810 [Bacteroidia bacterium]|nr:hypothetical protein [Bacteroidia bacterium]
MSAEIKNTQTNFYELLEVKIWPIVKRAKKYILVPAILGVLFFVIAYFMERGKKPVFSTKITFMLEDEIINEGSKGAGPGSQILMALSGQSPSNNKAIMVDLATSNKLVEQTLLQEVMIDNKPIVLVNMFIQEMGIRQAWIKNKNAKLSGYFFSKDYTIGKDKELDYLLRTYSNQIKLSLKPTVMESGLITMTFSSNSEQFTKLFLETHLNTISKFYVDKKVERASSLVKFARQKKDSILALLTGRTYGLASMQDKGFGRVMKRSMVPETQARTDIGILNEQYSESVAALNAASINMERNKPFISVVDDIRLPLESKWPQPLNNGLFMGVVGIVLGIALIVGLIFGLDFLKSQKEAYKSMKIGQ